MKKTLIILWIIIIAGTVFIAVELFKPEGLQDISTQEPETEVITLDPNDDKNYSEYVNLGDHYFKNEVWHLAVENYEIASTMSPNTKILIKLGESYLYDNEPEKAEKAFIKANTIEPGSLEANLGIARTYLNKKNIESAKEIIWTLDITNYEVKYYRGIVLILYKEFDAAKNQFKAIVNSSQDENATAVDTDLYEKAENLLNQFDTFDYYKEGDEIFLETLLAKALTENNEFEASIPLLYDVINIKNNYRDAWIVLGYAYLNTDKALDAIDAFSQAEVLEPEKPETLYFLGLSYFANDEIEKAIYYLEKAEKNGFEPKDQINLKLGELYLLLERYELSAKKYETVLSLNPRNIDIFVKAIWLNIDKLNNAEKALELAEKATQNHPGSPMSYNLKGWALTAMGQYTEAQRYLEKALEMKEDFDAAILNLGWLNEKQGLSTLAKHYYKKAFILGDGNSISTLAATRFNKLTEAEINQYYQIDISAP